MADEAYPLSLAPAARQALTDPPPTGLPMAVAAAAGRFLIDFVADRPYLVGKPLTREFEGYYAARRGSYRVVYRIDERTRTVHVVLVDHRADVSRS
jgi:mRNA interferase RelE/StbE